MKILPFIQDFVHTKLKKNGFMIIKTSREEVNDNIGHWINLDHLRPHIVKIKLSSGILTYRGRSVMDVDSDPYLHSLFLASKTTSRKHFLDTFVEEISNFVKPGRTYADAFNLPERSDLKRIPEWGGVLPWEQLSSKQKLYIYEQSFIRQRPSLQKINIQLQETILYSEEAWMSHAKQYYKLYRSILKHGFISESYPIINVLVSGSKYKYIMSGSGNHRVTSAAIAGVDSVNARIGKVINVRDIEYWPNVINSQYSVIEAKRIFEDYFNESGYGSYV